MDFAEPALAAITQIKGNIDSTPGLIYSPGVTNAEIRFLKLQNNSVSWAWGIIVEGGSLKVTNVTIETSCTGSCHGIDFGVGGTPRLTNVNIVVSGGWENYGISSQNNASPELFNVNINASGTGSNYGVYNGIAGKVAMRNTSVTATGGATNYGVYNYGTGGGKVKIDSSTLTGTSATLYSPAGSTNYLSNTQLVGGPITAYLSSIVKCNSVYDANYDPYVCQ